MCHAICGTTRALHRGQPLNGELPTLVGFGAAACRAGFGHACAPLKMLRERLELHGAIITLLNENYTSQRYVYFLVYSDFDNTLKCKRGEQRFL